MPTSTAKEGRVMSAPVTPERIEGAIAWYWKHSAEIDISLPIATPGVTFLVGWPKSLELHIAGWEEGDYPLRLAISYIHRPITLVALALQRSEKIKERNHAQSI